ncbi:MAG: hypothetical protein V4556_10485 [Bacteroidota bacterium]
MKRVLIISPHFPPMNYPDMQRIRMSLPYYKAQGWEPVVLCADDKDEIGYRDYLLNDTIPEDIEVHKIKAYPVKYTSKVGLGSLSMRCYFQMKKKGDELLKGRKFDLVFFSTTMFHVCALGRYWKKKFNIPFILDMQDPWRNDYYLKYPKRLRPKKYKFAYNIHKAMEAYTVPHVDGIMSVSEGYISMLKDRYPSIVNVPGVVIPFGTSEKDFEVVKNKNLQPEFIGATNNKINVVYIGAIVPFSVQLVKAFFISFEKNIPNKDDYHFYFIGTNYSVNIINKKIEALAKETNLSEYVTELPQRISYFSALATLKEADILFIPGSMDVDYNASKIYNNILAGKPIFSVFNNRSTVKKIIDESNAGVIVGVNGNETEEQLVSLIDQHIDKFKNLHKEHLSINKEVLAPFFAEYKTMEQVQFFNKIVDAKSN